MASMLPKPPLDLLSGASLFLDFDGTLVEIATSPETVEVEPSLRALLPRLAEQLEGRVVLVTGRPAAEVRALLGCVGLHVVGSHGLEFDWADRARQCEDRPSALAGVLAEMRALAIRSPGLTVEDKPLGAALHFRALPEAQSDCVALAERLAQAHGLHLQHGKMMVEVRAGGGDKGSAIRKLMAEPSFTSTRPLFMGDDVTDEPGFRAAAELGGSSVLVGKARETAAGYRLASVTEARRWLAAASVGPA